MSLYISTSFSFARAHTHTLTHGNRYSEQAVRFLANGTKLCRSIDENKQRVRGRERKRQWGLWLIKARWSSY